MEHRLLTVPEPLGQEVWSSPRIGLSSKFPGGLRRRAGGHPLTLLPLRSVPERDCSILHFGFPHLGAAISGTLSQCLSTVVIVPLPHAIPAAKRWRPLAGERE